MQDSAQTLPPMALEDSVLTRFQQVARLVPDLPVILDGEQRITYAELDTWSDGIAATMIDRVGTEPCPVALYFKHGVQVIAAIMGVLKAGHFYSVMDPTIPESRLRTILDNLHAKHIVVDAATAAMELGSFTDLAFLPIENSALRPPADRDLPQLTADALAAICYTSGTTDRPKGVMWDHAMITHCVWQGLQIYPIRPGDVTALLYTAAYPASVTDLFGALLNGGALAIYRLADQGVINLRDWLTEERITILHLHATVLRQLLDTLPPGFRLEHVRYVRPSGRTTAADLRELQSHLHPDAIIVHSLTSSETCPITRYVMRPDAELGNGIVPLGFPIETAEIQLRGADQQVVTDEGVGEIFVRSRYLARGYWNQPELTVQRFQTDPADPRYRIYRMGDLARRRPDGMLELLGRNDRRVKIRGFTVDLEAIEVALIRLPGVREAVVVTRVATHDTVLVAYMCLDVAAIERSVSALRAALAQELPAYMLPARFVLLDALPRQPNGKVDVSALPAVGKARPGLDTPFVAPRSELEQQIADIWAELLELDEVGIADDFFELGGDSILAMRMVLAVEQRLGCSIPLDFLRIPTVANVASLLAGEPTVSPFPSEPTGVIAPQEPRQPGATRPRGWLRNLAARIEHQILELPLSMPYQGGMAWLRRWAGQPLVQRVRYAGQRRLFREFAASFDSPQTDDRHAFAEAILNSIWGSYIRQMGRGLSPAELVTALQGSRWPFWRDFGGQLAASLRDPAGPSPYDIVGEDTLRAAIRQGRGVILVAPHLPFLGIDRVIFASLGIFPHGITGAAFAQVRADLNTVARPLPVTLSRNVPHAHELLGARQRLVQGEAVYIPIDAARGVGPRIYTPVGQRLFPFNLGAIELTLVTDAPLLPVTTMLQPDNRLLLTIGAPLDTGDSQVGHDDRVWIAAQACGEFLASLWRAAPFARTFGDMQNYLNVSRSSAEVNAGEWSVLPDTRPPENPALHSVARRTFGTRSGPSRRITPRRILSHLAFAGPIWCGHGLPYGLGVRLQRQWVRPPVIRQQLLHRAAPFQKWLAILGREDPEGRELELSLLANTWLDWREIHIEQPDIYARWVLVRGASYLDAALASGRPIVLVGTHTAIQGGAMRMAIRQRTDREAWTLGYTATGPADAAAMVVYARELLTQGGIVQVTGDGAMGRRGVTLPVYGRPWLFRSGGAELALDTGAVMLPVFNTLARSGHITIEFLAPLTSIQAGRQAQIEDLTRQYAALLVQRWPDLLANMQWNKLRQMLNYAA